MTDYKGSGADQARIRQLEKKREQERQQFTAQIQKAKHDTETSLRDISQKFAARTSTAEDQLKEETVGLVTAAEFRKKKQELILEGPGLKEAPKRKRETRVEKSRLSFADDEEEQEDDNQADTGANSGAPAEDAEMMPPPAKRIAKDPSVDTSFLPDRERDEAERQERLRLKQEWLAEQERRKEEIIPVTFSYYDGTGHRRTLKVKCGTTIEQFLGLVRKEFKELRGVSTDNLLFIKEDLILPHNYSFYELVETKARGKSGPLFYWDVHEDVRFESDASVEKEESHAAKVVERRFYDANKHIFPMNRWEIFDPNKKYDSYSIKDTNKK